MANPSLQIGNGKFAIKENDLLGYSSSGAKFFPIPITMTRATLGSRVNPSGLIEDVELLGSELIQDSDFLLTGTQAENVTGTYWTTGTGWTISGGTANCDGSQTSGTQLTQTGLTFTNTKTYKVTYTVTVSAGNIDARLQGGGATVTGTSRTSSGTYTDYLISTGNTSFRMRGNDAFIGTVDNVSVKEATIDGLARVDYTDGTGSLLVEPQRTNLVTYSEDFSQSFWTKSSVTLTTGFVAPDGTTNASKLVSTGADGSMQNSYTVSSGTTYTISVYLKTVSGTLDTTIGLGSPGFPQNEGTGGRYKNITVTNEWQRYSLTSTADSSAASGVGFGGFSGFSTGEEVLIWGIQLEEGSYATSYIKTQGSTVTRNQDEYTKTGISDKINSEEGVLFAEVAVLSDDSTLKSITLSDSSTANRVIINYSNASNRLTADVRLGGVGQAFMQTFSYTITNFLKIALKYKENDFALWVNGTEVATDTSGSTFTANTLNRLGFDNGGSGELLFSKVRQVQVFKTALSDSELATLTTI